MIIFIIIIIIIIIIVITVPALDPLALDVFWNSEFVDFGSTDYINLNASVFLQQITLNGIK